MEKNLKVFGVVILIIAIVFLFGLKSVSAAENSNSIESVQEVAGVFEPEKVEQKIVNVDSNAVTIELRLKNKTEIKANQDNAEIILLLDDSGSMSTQCDNSITRKKKVIDSAVNLVNSIYKNTKTIKMGIVKFSSSASAIQSLTDDKNAILNSLNNEAARAPEGATDLAAGIRTAKDTFSKEAKNKILVVLTDGVPNDVGAAKNELNTLKTSDIYSISMLISGNVSSEDSVAEQVFGTEKNPTTDKYYRINDANIQQIINTDILTNIVNKLKTSIDYKKVVEEFPDEIVNNFEFSAIDNNQGNNNIMTIKNEYNTKKRITWKINNDNIEDDVIIRYRLILKNNYDTSIIINRVLSTTVDTKITYNYINTESKKIVKTQSVDESKSEKIANEEEYKLNDSTKIIIKEIEKENKSEKTTNINKDETIAKSAKLPQTGENEMIVLGIIFATIGMNILGILLLKIKK